MVKKPVLAMAILIRNEVDVLADNIRFHHQYGVDAFVMGTMALLLAQTKPNVIVCPRGLIKVEGGNHSASHLLW